jgi:hypothetical protein
MIITYEEWALFIFRCYDFATEFDGAYEDNNISISTAKSFYVVADGGDWPDENSERVVKTEFKIRIFSNFDSGQSVEAILNFEKRELISATGLNNLDGRELFIHFEKISNENTLKLKKILKLNQ